MSQSNVLPRPKGRSVLLGTVHVRGNLIVPDLLCPLWFFNKLLREMFPEGMFDMSMEIENSMIDPRRNPKVFFVEVHHETWEIIEMPSFYEAPWMIEHYTDFMFDQFGNPMVAEDPVEVRVICRM